MHVLLSRNIRGIGVCLEEEGLPMEVEDGCIGLSSNLGLFSRQGSFESLFIVRNFFNLTQVTEVHRETLSLNVSCIRYRVAVVVASLRPGGVRLIGQPHVLHNAINAKNATCRDDVIHRGNAAV